MGLEDGIPVRSPGGRADRLIDPGRTPAGEAMDGLVGSAHQPVSRLQVNPARRDRRPIAPTVPPRGWNPTFIQA